MMTSSLGGSLSDRAELDHTKELLKFLLETRAEIQDCVEFCAGCGWLTYMGRDESGDEQGYIMCAGTGNCYAILCTERGCALQKSCPSCSSRKKPRLDEQQ